MDKRFLDVAIDEAKKAINEGEVPVGAVIVKEGKVIAKAHNEKEKSKDCTAHAEILAIRRASSIIENWRLCGCEMYVTLEPCPMCAAAIAAARIKKVYIGTFDPVMGAAGSCLNLLQNDYLNYNVDVNWLYSQECSNIITDFFKNIR
ncbi:tRNA-adenosine deaminase [Clostridium acidisoli DSM 12555]|uniref:tRNA-specific adenosine deaminase n=1 Tax=Clostridium acidisoli DSM 12555 TaxID=1121291 RepID=A0A1W1XTR5_9CLOT|nr:nucleoside deaminase [Clostridium acidisoli]SMC27353.1 tRNA-adenosine deaminase [Clostridium acidisoli DSM 12555]